MKLIALERIHFGYGFNQSEILDDLNLVVNPGECHCINGPTGSGKSSLLHLLAGELSRPYEGDVYRHPSLLVGLVMQDPNVQILRQSVGAEIAFALENLGIAADSMVEKVQDSLRRVGLYISLDTPVEVLSLGQKYRLMLAAQLVFKPSLLLLDEPWAQLDDNGVRELHTVLASLLEEGVAIVMVEHNPSAFADLVNYLWYLKDGRLENGHLEGGNIKAGSVKQFDAELDLNSRLNIKRRPRNHSGESLVKILPHHFRFVDQDCLFDCVEPLSLYSGEIVALVGDNGTGKTSLLKTLAGIQANIPTFPITLLGKRPQLGIYGADLGLLMQRPNRQLFEQSVLAELQFSLKRFKLPLSHAELILHKLGLTHLAECSPHKLSYGQQHTIALASLVCLQPKVLLLDDPFAGLDKQHVEKVVQLLQQLSAQGCAILLTSHREIPFLEVDRYWLIESGQLTDGARVIEQSNVG
ncbi:MULTISPECIES: ATP-binding cassette domain-containing protein [unclassified Shewanella]|uniref:ATP-binding cassette domain-containing protein n=1 Tax=unclassified Shewanella TaxID=196818 RepID=UPI001BC3A446|nr:MULTISPECIES: ATP-binding cassette domain-containing protein [unclassified Shewanella]GIU14511.1 ABC transporter [Shewanella sp. MBTL60-112-B1]GIU29459.1 ABC transporter [Shewanella sp. MBTL60-112-B2]